MQKAQSILRKLFIGKENKKAKLPNEAYKNQLINIKRVWNNKTYNDFGIERLFRLVIVSSQLFFPGMLVRSISGLFGLLARKIFVEIYVLLKLLFPLLILFCGLAKYNFIFSVTIYLILETLFYLANLIFLSDLNARPISYKRSIILVFINYLEITLSYAVLYSHGNYLNHGFKSAWEAVYFSFITTATIGYGDFSPTTEMGQILVITQSIFFFVFLGIILTFYSSRIEDTSYYNDDRIDKWKNPRH